VQEQWLHQRLLGVEYFSDEGGDGRWTPTLRLLHNRGRSVQLHRPAAGALRRSRAEHLVVLAQPCTITDGAPRHARVEIVAEVSDGLHARHGNVATQRVPEAWLDAGVLIAVEHVVVELDRKAVPRISVCVQHGIRVLGIEVNARQLSHRTGPVCGSPWIHPKIEDARIVVLAGDLSARLRLRGSLVLVEPRLCHHTSLGIIRELHSPK
jgi:hypothetical protein